MSVATGSTCGGPAAPARREALAASGWAAAAASLSLQASKHLVWLVRVSGATHRRQTFGCE